MRIEMVKKKQMQCSFHPPLTKQTNTKKPNMPNPNNIILIFLKYTAFWWTWNIFPLGKEKDLSNTAKIYELGCISL